MRRLRQIILFTLIVFCVHQPSLAQKDERVVFEKQAAGKAWEALLKAKGGRERLHSVANMLTEYSDITRLDVFPSRMWEFSGPFYGNLAILIYDADKFPSSLFLTNQYGESDDRKHSYDYIALDRVVWLLETKSDKPEILGVQRKKEGKVTFDIIEAKVGEYRLGFAYEPEEMLVRRVYFYDKNGKMWQIYGMGDYKLIDGIQMPQQWDSKSVALDKNLTKFDYSPIKFTFNVDYDPNIFNRSIRATTADAWKPKRNPK